MPAHEVFLDLLVDSQEEVLLVLEVVVERALRHPRPPADLVERHRRVSPLTEQAPRRLHEGGAGVVGVL